MIPRKKSMASHHSQHRHLAAEMLGGCQGPHRFSKVLSQVPHQFQGPTRNGLANFEPEKTQVVHFYQHVPIHPILNYNYNIILGPLYWTRGSFGWSFFRGMGLPTIDRVQEQDPNVPRFRNLNKLSISFQWMNTNKKWIGWL